MIINAKGVLSLRRNISTNEGRNSLLTVALVPRKWYEYVMRLAHEQSAHMAADNTTKRAQQHFYFPNMFIIAQEVVRNCDACNLKKKEKHPQRHTLHSRQVGYPLELISIDFVGPFQLSARRNRYLLTIRDEFTKWPEAYAVADSTSETVVRILSERYFPTYGLPQRIVSDNGPHFSAHICADLARALKIQWSFTTPYNPQANPVERLHRDLNNAIRAFAIRNPRTWDVHVPAILLMLRTTVHSTTKATPFRLMFGREAQVPLELQVGNPNEWHDRIQSQNANTYSQTLRNTIAIAYKYARDNIQQAIRRRRKLYINKKEEFTVGQRVYLYIKKGRFTGKLKTNWTGPWTIIRRINPVTYELQSHPDWPNQTTPVVGIDRIKPFITQTGFPEPNNPPPLNADLTFDGDEQAESNGDNIYLDDDDDHATTTPIVLPQPIQNQQQAPALPLPNQQQAPPPLLPQPVHLPALPPQEHTPPQPEPLQPSPEEYSSPFFDAQEDNTPGRPPSPIPHVPKTNTQRTLDEARKFLESYSPSNSDRDRRARRRSHNPDQ